MTLEKTVADCVATLEQARNVLRETALELLRTDVGVKGPLVAKMLEESDRIDIVCKGAKQSASKSQRLAGPCMEAGATASAQLLQTPHRKSPNVGTSVVTFPYVFISDGLLYKVGQKERPNPDGTRGTWWKSVSVEEALIIMKGILQGGRHYRLEFLCQLPAEGYPPVAEFLIQTLQRPDQMVRSLIQDYGPGFLL